ncbi:unnamed protein product, partial [Amoebophrya sp. A25]
RWSAVKILEELKRCVSAGTPGLRPRQRLSQIVKCGRPEAFAKWSATKWSDADAEFDLKEALAERPCLEDALFVFDEQSPILEDREAELQAAQEEHSTYNVTRGFNTPGTRGVAGLAGSTNESVERYGECGER